ncbi:hypothetical protein IW262DRAFT_1393702 [Armillaria fumosa]|nr:hypothetical protein IW262DRAFT_1393702 [Armillaria fumosa]
MEFKLGNEIVTLPVVVRVYRRDRALKWNEIWTQLKHWGTYPPARYCIPPVEREHLYLQQYPRHTKWFRRMVRRFRLDGEGFLVEKGTGLRVSTDHTDFEFKALLVYDPRDVALQYDAVSLVSRIQKETQAWHIDALPRAQAIIDHLREEYLGLPHGIEPRMIDITSRTRWVADWRSVSM